MVQLSMKYENNRIKTEGGYARLVWESVFGVCQLGKDPYDMPKLGSEYDRCFGRVGKKLNFLLQVHSFTPNMLLNLYHPCE